MERMWLRMGKTIGIFDQATFRYKPVPFAKGLNIPESADIFLEKWKRSDLCADPWMGIG